MFSKYKFLYINIDTLYANCIRPSYQFVVIVTKNIFGFIINHPYNLLVIVSKHLQAEISNTRKKYDFHNVRRLLDPNVLISIFKTFMYNIYYKLIIIFFYCILLFYLCVQKVITIYIYIFLKNKLF